MPPPSVIKSRRDIVRACKARRWTVQPAALKGIEQAVFDSGEDLQFLLDLIGTKMNKKNHHTTSTITADLWEEIVHEQEVKQYDPSTTHQQQQQRSVLGAVSGDDDSFRVVNAFETPRLVFEVMRRQFQVQQKNWPLLGTAEDKINMLAQRYALIHQRILRHELFRPTDLHRSSSSTQHKLTPVESLLGKQRNHHHGSSSSLILLLGILLQIEEGRYYLEDPTGQVPVSFQQAVVTDGCFVTEHCVLLVEGHYQDGDGIFYIHRVGHPLQETRASAMRAIQQQVSHPAYAALPKKNLSSSGSTDTSFVILSDLHLDQPRVLQQLEGLLATYENYSVNRLPLFVLMGNFCSSSSSTGNTTVKSAMDELISLIARFPSLASHAHFCIVPGPNDGLVVGNQVLPFPPIKFQQNNNNNNKVANCHFASNPCRICWNGREMVIFRYDLLHLMQQHQITLQPEESNDDDDDEDAAHRRLPHCRLVKTILDQGHLVPVVGVPVFWNYDQALSLYPLPDCLVLGGDSAKHFHETYWDCNVIHPGSMTRHSTYAVYSPDKYNNGDDESVDSMMVASSVEFCHIGDEVTME